MHKSQLQDYFNQGGADFFFGPEQSAYGGLSQGEGRGDAMSRSFGEREFEGVEKVAFLSERMRFLLKVIKKGE